MNTILKKILKNSHKMAFILLCLLLISMDTDFCIKDISSIFPRSWLYLYNVDYRGDVVDLPVLILNKCTKSNVESTGIYNLEQNHDHNSANKKSRTYGTSDLSDLSNQSISHMRGSALGSGSGADRERIPPLLSDWFIQVT